MRTRALVVTCVVGMSLLGGCASAPEVRQAKLAAPVVLVAEQSAPKKKAPEKPKEPKAQRVKKAQDEAEKFGLLGVLGVPDGGVVDSITGPMPPADVTQGILAGLTGSGGFGGLGLSGSGIGGGGGGFGGGIGLGAIGTLGLRRIEAPAPMRYGADERPKVKIGVVTVQGPMMVDVVQRHVDEHRDDLQTCHSLEYKESGNRRGSLTLRLHIEATGRVDDVQIQDSTVSSRDLESCLAHAVGAFAFPSPGANAAVTVLLPITF